MTEDFKILNIYCVWFLKHEGNNISLCCAYLLSHVWLFATPWTIAHQAPLSTGILQQQYWTGLPCPSPRDLPNPAIEPWSPALQADSLPSEPPEKPKKTGVGNLSLLQGNFPSQESNWGLLHCWQILYQLSYLGSPNTSFSSVQFSSVAQLCPTLCDPMNCSMPGLPVHHQLPEFTQTHVHWVGDAIQPSLPLSSSSPPAPNPSQHRSLFQWVNSLHEVAKVLEFQL